MKAYPMLKWAKELFPLCRSITGNGTRSTLNYFKAINKDMEKPSITDSTFYALVLESNFEK